jgi:hypothetical protein
MEKSIKPIKTERHHWWPQGVSKRWLDEDGVIHQLFWDGRDIPQTNTKNFGVIGNAHSIKFAVKPTVWDQCFEGIFQSADKAFPSILDWLNSLEKGKTYFNLRSQQENKENLDILLECILSLVVRSPRFRHSLKSNISLYNKNVREHLINLNQRDVLNRLKANTLGRGKFAILFSSDHEFIFGDGFYHNFTSIDAPSEPKIIIPLLPNVCIFYSRPISYNPYPRLVTTELSKDEIDFINRTTMVYSRDFIFYRSQKPDVTSISVVGSF